MLLPFPSAPNSQFNNIPQGILYTNPIDAFGFSLLFYNKGNLNRYYYSSDDTNSNASHITFSTLSIYFSHSLTFHLSISFNK